ncbi:MAG: helix-turn-helix domain-containing protein [Solirubrobacteraceae bacterium]
MPATVVGLLDVEPELGRDLDEKQRIAASRLALRVRSVTGDSTDIDQLIADAGALGVVVVEGVLLRRIRVDHHASLRLFGPGDIYMPGAEPESPLLAESSCLANSGTRLALLNNEILVATHRWPPLVAGLLRRVAEQGERIALQLAIGHLPRVEDRLLAIFDLMAEQWGYVTPDGKVIPLQLTHETLGGLVGARRSTVSLALRTLSDRGTLIKHTNGWLLRRDVTARRSDPEKAARRKRRPLGERAPG